MSMSKKSETGSHLLYLPLVVFRDIVRDLIQMSPSQAWRLRPVCRVFANEIRFYYLAKQNLEVMDTAMQSAIVNILERSSQARLILLLNRVRAPLGARGDLLEVINGMADFLVENGFSMTIQRQEYVEKLCLAVSDHMSGNTLFKCLSPENVPLEHWSPRRVDIRIHLQGTMRRTWRSCSWDRIPPTAPNLDGPTISKMAAAAIANDAILFGSLLDEISHTTELGVCPYLGFPLHTACKYGHHEIIETLAEFKEQRQIEGPTVVVYTNSWVSGMMVAIGNGHHSTLEAMVRLVMVRDSTIGSPLLGRYFERLVSLAVELKDIRALDIILDLIVQPTFNIPRDSLKRILDFGNQACKAHGQMIFDEGYETQSLGGIRSDSPSIPL